ncbi:MAG: serine/threonine-protein kinase [Myxococcales bacterium]
MPAPGGAPPVPAPAERAPEPEGRRELPAHGTVLCSRYRLERVIGTGASAAVYAAHDEVLDERVAIKLLLHGGLLESEEAKGISLSLRAEAVSTMRLSHPNVLRVFNYERHTPWEFLVMELVDGEDLLTVADRRPGKRLHWEETVRVGLQCLDALHHAHCMGVTHNDIKPSNILTTRGGSYKVCDFGLARIREDNATMTKCGTPAWIAPEVIKRERYTEKADIYSIGIVMWEVLTRKVPRGAWQPTSARPNSVTRRRERRVMAGRSPRS